MSQEFFMLVVIVPESHADLMREVMGRCGAGTSDHYAFCSFSTKGVGRFMPKRGANPFLGKVGQLSEEPEERIETICVKEKLETVLEAIKKAHPYEETVIEIYPIDPRGYKKRSP
jgi:hypothetical protein